MNRLRAVLVPVALVALLALGSTACSEASASAPTRASWVGTWSGDYDFSMSDGTSATSALSIVIDRQEGDLLWGHEEFVDQGTTITVPLNGSVKADGRGVLLVAPGLTFETTLASGSAMQLDFFKITEPVTAFSMVLTLQR